MIMMPCIEISNFNGMMIGVFCGFTIGYFIVTWRFGNDPGIL